ncbi:MAG TPA: hypothetical protein VK918_00685 [Pyrinomonadaceae bacterium]|nr:hypothetical protein [Pyrinomonadaceae bacterium]
MKTFLSAAIIAVSVFIIAAFGQDIWTVNNRTDILKGDARGVSIDETGAISLSPRLTELFSTGQPFIWSSVVDAQGNIYLGTGSEARIYRVTPAGQGALFADLEGLNVSAMAIGRSGELYAATAPDGKVYRINAGGTPEVFFDPQEKYIWSLALMGDGSLAVGTGEAGKIFRVRSAGAAPDDSLMFDSSETHIMSLAMAANGDLYAGTDPGGIVLRFGADGRPFALIDSPLREIHELAVGPDGSVYALALGESLNAATPSPSPSPTPRPAAAARPTPGAQPTPAKSRYDLTGAKSAVYRILPGGGNDLLWSSASVSAFSLYAHQTGSGVFVGTSDKGRIYNVTNDALETLALQTDAAQVSLIFGTANALYAASSNQGILYRIGPEPAAEGSYESEVLDAATTGTWGRLWWSGSGNVALETRSGNTESPNETWSPWQPVTGDQRGGRVASPPARFLQWRARLTGADRNAVLRNVNVAFRARNIAPEVLSISILSPHVGLIANPAPQIDPNIEIAGLDPADFGLQIQPAAPRRVYQRGALSFVWTAEDRNGDKLVYDVYFKEESEAAYKLLKADLSDTFFALDGLSLADGRYTIKVVAKDSPSNPAGVALSGERVSEPFIIDNTQPVVTAGTPQVTGQNARVVFRAVESSSYLVRAEFSVNGGPWQGVYADDGISDSREETYTVNVPLPASGEYSITLRAFDVNGNTGNASVVVRR